MLIRALEALKGMDFNRFGRKLGIHFSHLISFQNCRRSETRGSAVLLSRRRTEFEA